MEKHGYTPLHQAKLLCQKLEALEEMVFTVRGMAQEAYKKLLAADVDYGGIATPTMGDLVAKVNRSVEIAGVLNALITLAAIDNKQLPDG